MGTIPKEWTFTSHCWFDDDRVAVATHQGDVLIIDNCELKKVLPRIFKASSPSAPPPAVWSLYSLGRGFAAGGDAGCFSLYERTYDQDYFQSYKKFDTPHKHRLVDLSVSPNEESLLCCYDNNELAHFNLVGVDIVDHEKPEEVQQAFQLLPIGFHSEAVTAVDVCIQKPIVVTASADKQIRIWNFVKHRVEIRQQFPEEALCVSCHPTGLRLLVGFKFKMCMYSVLVDTLHLCQEFPIKQCREVRFSNGGQYFAAVVVNRIFIFNAYSFEPIGHLTGHSSMVKSFTWARNDQAIISAGFEGAIYEWKIDTCKRNETVEYTCKALTFSAVRYDDVNQLVIAVGCRKVAENGLPEGEVTLRVLKLGGVHDQDAPRSIANLGIVESKPSHNRSQTGEIALSTRAQTLFVGTPAGELHVYSWPMKRGNAVPDNVIELHNGEISFVHLTLDERYLLTVGEDGCMFIFDVDVLLEGKAPPRRSFNYSTFDDVAFVLQHDIDEKNREILTLQGSFSFVPTRPRVSVAYLKAPFPKRRH
ncbi:hypothetical protein DIPPA_17536 [Diplonema papillatum]|nr:hypothetical protein DIPPA_17536 [Diplonema papillatum]